MYHRQTFRKNGRAGRYQSPSMRISTCWFALIPNTFYLSETCSSTTIQEKNRESCWMVLSPGVDESDVAPLCSTSNLLITDQGGRTCASFASVASFPALCEWQAVLHAGDWARTFAVVPLHVYSAHSEQQSYIYPNLPHCYDTVVQEGTVTLLSSRPEKVAADHLLHKTRRANEKQLSPVTHTVGYFTEIKGVGASCGYLEDLWHQNISQTTKCTVRWFRSILHPDNTVVCHLRHFLNFEQCSDAWEQVVPGRRFLSVLYNVALCWQRGRRCRYRPVSSCLRQRGEDQR